MSDLVNLVIGTIAASAPVYSHPTSSLAAEIFTRESQSFTTQIACAQAQRAAEFACVHAGYSSCRVLVTDPIPHYGDVTAQQSCMVIVEGR